MFSGQHLLCSNPPLLKLLSSIIYKGSSRSVKWRAQCLDYEGVVWLKSAYSIMVSCSEKTCCVKPSLLYNISITCPQSSIILGHGCIHWREKYVCLVADCLDDSPMYRIPSHRSAWYLSTQVHEYLYDLDMWCYRYSIPCAAGLSWKGKPNLRTPKNIPWRNGLIHCSHEVY